ncbi:MAG TPA: hypothetical protein VIG47_14965 [Gemmatimonadaceae bacterium]
MNTPDPIACTLSPEALADRIGRVSALNRDFLLAYSLERTTLRLTYDAAAARDVRALVASERECCGFLRFAIGESANAIELCIRAPNVGDMISEPLFAPFLSGAR